MSTEPTDVNFKDEPEIHQTKPPKGVKDTNGETWHCDQDWDGDCGQPYPELNEAGFVSLADQKVIERDEKDTVTQDRIGVTVPANGYIKLREVPLEVVRIAGEPDIIVTGEAFGDSTIKRTI